jgi:serine/threonine protein kinase
MRSKKKDDFMQKELHYQRRPRLRWETVESLGNMHGGLNAGILKVRTNRDNLGRVFIEKRFGKKEFGYGVPWREIRMLHQVGDHPNITTMVDHFLDDSSMTASVFLEYCDIGNLANVVEMVAARNGQLNEHKVWSWFTQILEALVYCHRGPKPEDDKETMKWDVVYHRDIKPPNILLKQENGQIMAKLADFGCATSQNWTWLKKRDLDASYASAQTFGFDAPEHPIFSGASDIWQLALTMVCVCTGLMNPHSKLNPRGQRWFEESVAGPKYSKELSEVLIWGLHSDAKQRLTVMPLMKKLKEKYGAIKERLRSDTQPLEILDRPEERSLPQSQSVPSQHYAQPISPLVGSRSPRPPPLAHMMSDPEAHQMGLRMNDYADLVRGQRSPQGPFPVGHPLGQANDLMNRGFEMEDDDPRLHLGHEPRMFGGFHPHQGYFPPFHPHNHRGRRR